MEISKEEFLKEFGEDYGYPNSPKNIDEIRATEFKRLESMVYLDHAGATLYSESQMEAVAKDLTSNVYGNPHSQSDSSTTTSDMISAARQQVLDYFNASPKDYKCIFTSGATAALKLVGECFPWSRESYYMYTMENHNSVLGIREYALDQGSTAVAVDIEEFEHHGSQYGNPGLSIQILKHSEQRRDGASPKILNNENPLGNAYNLFAFPSECNFSGVKYPLQLVKKIKEDGANDLEASHFRGSWLVLIDAAKGCTTDPPDLSRYHADFLVFSFYKIFGYPTGLGALVVRTDAARILNKTYFSGGTVSASIADIDFVKRRGNIEQLLEDGTLSFLSIASIRHGFKIIDALTISSITRHTSSLATFVRNILASLKYENGVAFCKIYGIDMSKVHLGPTIAFNLRREDGSWIGYREVEKLASLSGIHLRTGCFCNPGACAKYLDLSHSELLSNIEAGHVCWDDNDILHGKPTGVVRISFGYMSTFEDVEKFVKFLVTSFLVKPKPSRDVYLLGAKSHCLSDTKGRNLVGGIHLKFIIIYPVKSCAGFSVDSWPLTEMGLLYDREWLIRGPGGDILTQKKVPKMCHIRTSIDLGMGKLYVESPHSKTTLHISLRLNSSCTLREEMDVYGQRYEVQSYGDEVNMWFTGALARPCTFVRCLGSENRYCRDIQSGKERMCRDIQSKLNFANEAQLLLLSEDSINDLNCRISSNNQRSHPGSGQPAVVVDAMRFRPNLIVSGAEPFAEDNWKSLLIGKEQRFVSLGGCNRCQMINIDQKSGLMLKSREPLATLASYRRVQGKILFGILLRYEYNTIFDQEEQRWLKVGHEVYPS